MSTRRSPVVVDIKMAAIPDPDPEVDASHAPGACLAAAPQMGFSLIAGHAPFAGRVPPFLDQFHNLQFRVPPGKALRAARILDRGGSLVEINCDNLTQEVFGDEFHVPA